MVAVIEGADAGWRVGYQHHPLGKEHNPWIAEAMWEPRDAAKNQPAYILSPIANLPDGPSGLVHYPGTGLPAEYNGSFFLAGYKGSTAKSQISTFKTEPDGAGFKLVGLKTFMDNVQATDVDFGPDSRFYVSAWDEGWERSDQGRIYRLSHDAARTAQAAQIAEVQKILGEGFKKRTPEELIKLLAHGDQRVRLGAQWELAERCSEEMLRFAKGEPNPTAIEEAVKRSSLVKLIESAILMGVEGSKPELAQIHAIWLRGQAHRKFAAKLKKDEGVVFGFGRSQEFETLARHHDPKIRAQIWRMLGDNSKLGWSEEIAKFAVEALNDSEPQVRAFAARLLGSQKTPAATLPLLKMLEQNNGRDAYIEHAGVVALAASVVSGSAPIDELRHVAASGSRSTRLAALLAARRLAMNKPAVASQRIGVAGKPLPPLRNEPLGIQMLVDFLTDKDPTLIREAAIAINDAPVPSAMPALAKRLIIQPEGGQMGPNPTADEPFLIRALNANFRVGGMDGANSLATYAARATNDGIRVIALNMLGKWAKPPQRDYITGTFRPLPERPATDAAFQLNLVAAELLGDKAEKVVIAACEALAANDVKTSSQRVLAVLRNEKASQKSRLAALDALAKLATPEFETSLVVAGADANPALKTAASKLMGKRTPDLAAAQLIAAWASSDAAQKQDIATALGETKSVKSGEFLVKVITGIKNEPAEAQLEILEAAAKHENAKAAVADYENALPANDLVAKFRVALSGGDKEAGEVLFKEHPVAACLRCHKISNSGGDAGPDLTGFASNHDRAYILESIVNVNAKIAPNFQMVILTMKDGSVKAGTLKSEENGVLTLANPGMPAEQVKAADVTKRDNAPSGMIPNLGDLLTKRELRDIVEYVSTLK